MSAVFEYPMETCRSMTEGDLPAVLDIERRSYAFPWSEGIFHNCLHHDLSCWVVELDRQVIGYGVMSVAVQECHILNLCVDPSYQGQGIGGRLLDQLLAIANSRNADTAFLEVRTTNFQAISLYFSKGFNEIGTRKNYYPALSGREDAIILVKSLDNTALPHNKNRAAF